MRARRRAGRGSPSLVLVSLVLTALACQAIKRAPPRPRASFDVRLATFDPDVCIGCAAFSFRNLAGEEQQLYAVQEPALTLAPADVENVVLIEHYESRGSQHRWNLLVDLTPAGSKRLVQLARGGGPWPRFLLLVSTSDVVVDALNPTVVAATGGQQLLLSVAEGERLGAILERIGEAKTAPAPGS